MSEIVAGDEAIRHRYEEHGVREFYERYGAAYRNPHEQAVGTAVMRANRAWQLDCGAVLDLACGSGEVTLALRALGISTVQGIDPYTGAAFTARTGQSAEPFSFEQIADGVLVGRRYSLIVCSFALHLVEPSRLPLLLYQLGQVSETLLVLTPHKRPQLKPAWGWELRGEFVAERVRARYYVYAAE